jgi:hypothetical protein
MLILAGLLTLCPQALGQPTPETSRPEPKPAHELVIPDLPTADMRLSWKDFRELLKLIQPEEKAAKKPPVPEKKKPPRPWAIQECTYRADATLGGTVRIDAAIGIHVWVDEWVTIPLLDNSVALASAKLDGETTYLTDDKDTFSLMVESPGAHTLEMTFYVAPTSKDGVVTFDAPTPRTPVTTMQLTIPEAEARVASPMAASVQARKSDKGLVADLVFQTSDKIEVSWRLPAKPEPPKPEVPKVPPRVACFTSTLATVSENHVACETLIQFDILRGDLSGFLLRLPEDVQVIHIEGKGAEWTVKEEDGQQWVTVAVNHDVTGSYPIALAYESAVAEGAATVSVPTLTVADVVRNTGVIAVATRGNLEVNPLDENEGVQRVDVSDLPTELQQRSATPILHAFRYNDPAYLLAMSYNRLEDVPVRVAGIDKARITSVLTEEGMLLTRATYFVRNHMKKYMRMDLGPDAEVWGAQVGGQVVRPARNEDDAAILVPLLKSTAGRKELGAFPVDVVYVQKIPQTQDWMRDFKFEAPKTDILANLVEWEVLLPESRAVYRTLGDMQPVDRLGPVVSAHSAAPRKNGRTASFVPEGESGETLYRLREGIERFFITDINNPAASVGGTSGPRYTNEQDPDAPQHVQPAGKSSALTVAGVLPIRVEIPRTGRAYNFERMVVPHDTALSVELKTYDARLRDQAGQAVQAAAFLAGLVAAWAVFCACTGRRIRRISVLLPGILICTLIPAALIGLVSWPTLLGRVFLGVIVAGGLALVQLGLRKGRHAWGTDNTQAEG